MALWTPAQIDTALWLDAADASTLTLDGSAVSEWRDKSGNARHSTPPGTKPQRTLAGIDGQASVVFASIQDILATPSFAPPTGLDGIAVYCVFRRSGEPVNYSNLFTFGSFNDQYSLVLASNSGALPASGRNTFVWRNNTTTGNTATSPAQSILTGTDYLWSGVMSNQSIKSFANGVELAGSQGAATRSFGADGPLRLGGQASDMNRFEGLLGEAIVVHADVTVATRQTIEGYLAHKWGLEANLPADHPYKQFAPGVALTVSGTVTDDVGQPAARTVRVYDRATGELLDTITSDAVTGAYEFTLNTADEVQRIVLDDAGGTLYNDIIDRVIPG